MDLLKQLETKMQALVQQRNQLKEELDGLKAAGDQELQSLRSSLDQALAEKAALEKDREAVKDQVAAILRALEALG
ncbi:MAG: hypothetical protein IT187_07180 [Geothrix sp.]|uniref:Cell division protein ZapB n=1 Tax=Candidatus Geothrix odensensis TaxID=2954440 RepID=A0A936K6Y9_9BACT|nr:hypothetical protein [Candidatus Geothrix odensensis]MCC6513780.1 hypothetical protein [Geothrix sp.]